MTDGFKTVGDARRVTYALLAAMCRQRKDKPPSDSDIDSLTLDELLAQGSKAGDTDISILLRPYAESPLHLMLMLATALAGWADTLWEIYHSYDGAVEPGDAAEALVQRMVAEGFAP